MKELDKLLQAKTFKYREAVRILESIGFQKISSKGTHEKWKHITTGDSFILAYKDGEMGKIQCQKIKEYITKCKNSA